MEETKYEGQQECQGYPLTHGRQLASAVIELLDLVWLVPGFRQTWDSLIYVLYAIACLIEIMRDPRKLFSGTVVIINLEIQDK